MGIVYDVFRLYCKNSFCLVWRTYFVSKPKRKKKKKKKSIYLMICTKHKHKDLWNFCIYLVERYTEIRLKKLSTFCLLITFCLSILVLNGIVSLKTNQTFEFVRKFQCMWKEKTETFRFLFLCIQWTFFSFFFSSNFYLFVLYMGPQNGWI